MSRLIILVHAHKVALSMYVVLKPYSVSNHRVAVKLTVPSLDLHISTFYLFVKYEMGQEFTKVPSSHGLRDSSSVREDVATLVAKKLTTML